MPEEAKKRRGRPALSDAERRTRNFTFRSRGALHDLLKASAKQNERSVSEEIERRLEQSFDRDQEIQHLFGNPPVFALMKILAQAMNLTGDHTNVGMTSEHWIWNPVAYDEAVKAASRILKAMRPQGEGHRPPYLRQGTGEKIAQAVLDKISGIIE